VTNLQRVTRPLLDVLEVFGSVKDEDLHGWAIMKAVNRPGPTVYGILDRLEDMGWITGQWETGNPGPGRPRRRFYRMTPAGHAAATQLLLRRRVLWKYP
jgi:PadR family transcriptional regulator, regulatory protein PadR